MKAFKYLIIATTKPVFLILFCALLLSHCGKKNDCEKVTEAPAEFLAPFWFPEGSYWVYERTDTNALVIDTMTIGFRKMSYETLADHEAFNPCYMDYLIRYDHSNDLFNVPGLDWGNEVFTSHHSSSRWTWKHSGDGRSGGMGFIFRWPHILRDTIMFSSSSRHTIYIQLTDTSVVVEAGSFSQSYLINKHFKDYSSADSVNIATALKQIIVKDQVGILAFEYVDGMRWELADYNLK
ncbi:MAG: hypothetical protein WD077_05080 [Bacteroidia bacterium]